MLTKLFRHDETDAAPQELPEAAAYREGKAALLKLKDQREAMRIELEAMRRERKRANANGQFFDELPERQLEQRFDVLETQIANFEDRVRNLRKAWQQAQDPTLQPGEKRKPPSWAAGMPLPPKSGRNRS